MGDTDKSSDETAETRRMIERAFDSGAQQVRTPQEPVIYTRSRKRAMKYTRRSLHKATHGSQEPINYRRKRKRKRYTRGTKDLQRLAYGVTKGSWRTAKGVTRGLKKFNTRSQESSRTSRDGAVVDVLKNAAKGIEKSSRDLGMAPSKVTKRAPIGRLWKYSRPAVTFLTASTAGFFR